MPSERAVLDLVGLIYDAAGDPNRWPMFLEQLAKLSESSVATFYAWDFRHGRTEVAADIGFDERFRRSLHEYYGERNVFMLRGGYLLQPGAIRMSEELCPDH